MTENGNPKWFARVGWGLTAVSLLAIAASAAMKIIRQKDNLDYIIGKFGFPDNTLVPMGVLELTCAILYAIPRTSVLGAVLLTGYFGGAIATHVRMGEAFPSPLILAIVVWVGIYLREPRLRALMPLRK